MTAIQVYKLGQSHNDYSDSEYIVCQIAGIEKLLFTYDAWSVAQINSLLTNNVHHILYAMDESKIRLIGYCIYNQLFEDAEILRIGTHPNYQQQGVASHLLNGMRQTIQSTGAKRILLEVREDNHAAIAFYQKYGFEQIAIRKNYYDNHDNSKTHALIMQHILASPYATT